MNGTLPRLMQLTQIKQEEIQKLFIKTQEQKDAIMEDDIERLNIIIDDKQDIIKYIDTINEEFKESYISMEKDERFEEVRRLLEIETKSIIAITLKIKQLEMEIKKELHEKIKETQGYIRQIKNQKKGIKAYFKYMPQNSYIDNRN